MGVKITEDLKVTFANDEVDENELDNDYDEDELDDDYEDDDLDNPDLSEIELLKDWD